jgi:hypothetical protein
MTSISACASSKPKRSTLCDEVVSEFRNGKTTIANLVEAGLPARGVHTVMLDGDNVRHGLNRDLGITEPDRV